MQKREPVNQPQVERMERNLAEMRRELRRHREALIKTVEVLKAMRSALLDHDCRLQSIPSPLQGVSAKNRGV